MVFKNCPRCGGNKWSNFLIKNTNYFSTTVYTKFCNCCHGFSFNYIETLHAEFMLENYAVQINDYMVIVDLVNNRTEVYGDDKENAIFVMDAILIKDITASAKQIEDKIKKLIVFS